MPQRHIQKKNDSPLPRPQHPFRRVFTGVEGDVLWALGVSRHSRTASDISRMTGRSKSQIQVVLERLGEVRLIDRSMFDGWSWNCLNENHPFVHHIRAMARQEFNDNHITVSRQAKAPDLWCES